MDYRELLGKLFLTPVKLGIVTLPFDLLEFILKFVLPLSLILIIIRLLNKGTGVIVDQTKLSEKAKIGIKKWTRRSLRLIFFILFLVIAGKLFGARMFDYLKMFYQTLNQPLFNLGKTSISIITLLLIIPIFYLSSWAGKAAGGIANQTMMERLGFDEARQFSLLKLLRYSVMILTFLIGLSIIGINLSSITVIFGVLGIGIGFGLQNSVANIFAGLLIILTRPIKEGDAVLMNKYEGTIDEIRAFSTVITTIMNETIIVPNSKLVSDVVYNYSYSERSVIIRNDVGVSYSSDIDRVIDLLKKVAKKNPYARTDKEPNIFVKEFASSSINIAVLVWIRDVKNKYEASHLMNLEIWRTFRANSIEIPFPQNDVYIKQTPETGNSPEDKESTD